MPVGAEWKRPTDAEVRDVFPKAAKGWLSANRCDERSFWVDAGAISGQVPKELSGTYMRNGPGLLDVFGEELKHPIDGDGMIVALTFANGRVHFANRFVRTASHIAESKAKRMLFNGNMGSNVRDKTGAKQALEELEGIKNDKVSLSKRMRDPAHTNVFHWGGKVLACYEYGLPHALDPSTLETIGQDTLGGALDEIKAFSAHFRVDMQQDLLVGIGFKAGGMGRPPRLHIMEFDRQWKLVKETKVSVDGLNYAHDFVMTPDYYVLHMSPFVDTGPEAIEKIFNEGKAPGELMGYTPTLPSRVVLVKRSGVSSGEHPEIIQLETEPCHIYHFQNAVQVNDSIITFGATCLPPGFNMDWQHKIFLSNTADAPGVYHEYRVDISCKRCVRSVSHKVRLVSNEFPTANPYRQSVKLAGRMSQVRPTPLPPRYVYLMAAEEGKTIPFTTIVKYDPAGDRDQIWRSPGIVGEPVFIPRLGRASAFYGDDDDGWIITQLYIPDKHTVHYVLLDAQNLANGPICTITPGLHIPFSFHGTWTEESFQHQRPKL